MKSERQRKVQREHGRPGGPPARQHGLPGERAARRAGGGPRPPEPMAQTAWDHVAAWYDRLVGDEGSDYHREVILPCALRLLDVVPGQRVLDLCCGQGVLARLLAERGVAGVLGVDASPQLVDAAARRERERPAVRGLASGPTAIEFRVGDATRGGPWADGSFDRAACVMAAHDVADFGGLARTLAAALKPGGRAALVLMHPCFRVPRQSSWGWDEQRKIQYRRVDRYAEPLEVPIHTRPGQAPGEKTLFFHRPLADYVNGLAAAGLAVVACEEPLSHRRAAPGGRSRGENRAAGEIPVFLGLAAVKLADGR